MPAVLEFRWSMLLFTIPSHVVTHGQQKTEQNTKNNVGRTSLFSTIRKMVTQQSWNSHKTVAHPAIHFLWLGSLKSKMTKKWPAPRVKGFQLQSTALRALQVPRYWRGMLVNYKSTLNSLLLYAYPLKRRANWILFVALKSKINLDLFIFVVSLFPWIDSYLV